MGGGRKNHDLHSTGGKKQIKAVGSLCAHNYKYVSHWILPFFNSSKDHIGDLPVLKARNRFYSPYTGG